MISGLRASRVQNGFRNLSVSAGDERYDSCEIVVSRERATFTILNMIEIGRESGQAGPTRPLGWLGAWILTQRLNDADTWSSLQAGSFD